MAKTLRVSVPVTDPDTGETTVYQAGFTVPAEHRALITNPDVWDGTEGEDVLSLPAPGPGQTILTEPPSGDEGEGPGDDAEKRGRKTKGE